MLWFSHDLLMLFSLSNILVFKLGGTSLSVSVMEVNSGMYRVLSTSTDDNIGGTRFTETLAQYLASEFQRWVLMELIYFKRNFEGFFPLIYLKLPCFEGGCICPMHWIFSYLELTMSSQADVGRQRSSCPVQHAWIFHLV